MKKLVILALILAAGLTAYPQSASRSKESKSKSSSSVSRSASKSSGSGSKSAATKSSSNNKSAATQSRSSQSASRSASVQSRGASKSDAGSRSSSANRSKEKSGNSINRSAQSSRSDSGNSAVRSSGSASNRSSGNSAVRSSGNSSSRSSVGNSASRSSVRDDSSDRIKTKDNSSSSSRMERSGNSVYRSRDGENYRHQNDEIFASRRYKVDYRDANELRNSNDFRRHYNDYYRWSNNRFHRHVVIRDYHYHAPLSIEIRRVRYPYRYPGHLDLCWTPYLHNRFMFYYPLHNSWNHHYGEYIESISSYDAMSYAGSVKRVYGKVEEVYYSPEDRTYTLYFGGAFPYHDFSVVIPKNIAKEFSWSPTWYFEDEHVWVVGLIDVWENKPEIVVRDEDQIRRY